MKHITKLKMAAIHQWCEENEKSTEYTIQCITDICNIDLDVVMAYLKEENHIKLFKELNGLCDVICKLENLTN